MSRMLWIHVDMTTHDNNGVPVDLAACLTDEFGEVIDETACWSAIWEEGSEYGDEIDMADEVIRERWSQNGLRSHFGGRNTLTRDALDEKLLEYFEQHEIKPSDALAGFELDWIVIPALVKHFPKFSDEALGLQMIDMRQIQWICENVNPELDKNINRSIIKEPSARSMNVVTRFIHTYQMYLENFLIVGDDE